MDRISLSLLKQLRKKCIQYNLPNVIGRKDKEDQDLYFAVKGNIYTIAGEVDLENSGTTKMQLVHWQGANKGVQVRTETFQQQNDPELLTWFLDFIKTQKMKKAFASTQYYCIDKLIKISELQHYQVRPQQLAQLWKKHFQLETDEELELLLQSTHTIRSSIEHPEDLKGHTTTIEFVGEGIHFKVKLTPGKTEGYSS